MTTEARLMTPVLTWLRRTEQIIALNLMQRGLTLLLDVLLCSTACFSKFPNLFSRTSSNKVKPRCIRFKAIICSVRLSQVSTGVINRASVVIARGLIDKLTSAVSKWLWKLRAPGEWFPRKTSNNKTPKMVNCCVKLMAKDEVSKILSTCTLIDDKN